VLNTHQQWLCRRLASLGYVVNRQVGVADDGPAITQAVREGLFRADLVITTGGLGPTSDDLTRDLIAELLGKTLHEDAGTLAQIEEFFKARQRPMPDLARVQALVPKGAIVLPNHNGTAPGLAIEVPPNPFRATASDCAGEPAGEEAGAPKTAWLIMLPGPPRELRPMFDQSVAPLLQRELPLKEPFVCRTFRSTGIGESLVQEKILPELAELVAAGLDLGYCARPGQVDVSLAAHGDGSPALITKAEALTRKLLGGAIFGTEDEELAAVVIRMLMARKETLTLAESCTGGCIADQLTNVPGASAVLLAGLVTYSNEAKKLFLGVQEETLAGHGAVSEPVAREMAEGARTRTGADYALSVTGIAGPSGGTPEKPIGTVFIALASASRTVVLRNLNPYDRETFKQVTTLQALDLLRRNVRLA
jgi:nicotinamide-nucleotide amidase